MEELLRASNCKKQLKILVLVRQKLSLIRKVLNEPENFKRAVSNSLNRNIKVNEDKLY